MQGEAAGTTVAHGAFALFLSAVVYECQKAFASGVGTPYNQEREIAPRLAVEAGRTPPDVRPASRTSEGSP